MKVKSKILALSLGALLVGASTALATPIAGSMGFGVSTSVGSDPKVLGNDFVSWSATPADLSTSATATATDSNGNSSTAFGNGRGNWAADGNSGTIAMSFGWSSAGARDVNTNLAASNWSYTFTADTAGTFVMNYTVTGNGYTFGLWGFTLVADVDSGSGYPVTDPFDPSSSGQFIGTLTGGQTYTVYLTNNGNVSSEGGYTADGSVQGMFDWSIQGTSVPDGGSTVLLLGGAFAVLAITAIILGRRRLRRASPSSQP